MTNCKGLEIRFEEQNPQKWRVPLTEEAFEAFISRGNQTAVKVFGDGSLFGPLLFGRFFDPSDAFPLWDFESEILLSNLRSSGQKSVDWFHTESDYVLNAELPGFGKNSIQVCIENGRILEISGQWKQPRESKPVDWRSVQWWEYGYVRRLELPEGAGWKKIEANLINDICLEIKIPKDNLGLDGSGDVI